MKIYYISSVNDEKGECTVTTPNGIFEEIVALEDLSKFSESNTVIGYNKLTGKLEVKTPKSVYDYMESKAKLSGSSFHTPSTKCIKKATRVDFVDNTVNMYITDEYPPCTDIEPCCFVNELVIDWSSIGIEFANLFFTTMHDIVVDEDYEENLRNDPYMQSVDEEFRNLKFNIFINLRPYKYFYTQAYRDYYVSLCNDYHLNSIIVESNDMFKNAKEIAGIFDIQEFITSSETVIDLSKLTFPKNVPTYAIFGQIYEITDGCTDITDIIDKQECTILVNDSFYEADHKGYHDFEFF